MMNEMEKKYFFLKSNIKPNLGFKVVSPEDINGGEMIEIPIEESGRYKLIPYCLDFKKNHLIHAASVDPIDAAKATFHYDYIRHSAEDFLYMPAHAIPKNIPQIGLSTVLLFSPGRCGSTLLSKIIAKMGIRSISEPDIYSQVAIHYALNDKNTSRAIQIMRMLKWANHYLISPFVKEGSKNFLIKLRSHVNCAPGFILASFPPPYKTIFLKRDFPSWCKSRLRVFGNSLENNVDIYIQSLYCLKFLLKNSNCLIVNYEDLKANPTLVISKLSAFFETKVNFDDIREVLNQDSQADTKLARDKTIRELTIQQINAIDEIWSRRAPTDLLREISLLG